MYLKMVIRTLLLVFHVIQIMTKVRLYEDGYFYLIVSY